MREQYGYKVNGPSYLTRISQSYLCDLELVNKNNPSAEIIYIICQQLNISLKEFFDLETPIITKKRLFDSENYSIKLTATYNFAGIS